MIYSVEIAESAKKHLKKLPLQDRERILDKISALGDDPRPEGYCKLQGSSKVPLYRIRSGVYRIVYRIHDDALLVLVVEIGHRKEIYRLF